MEKILTSNLSQDQLIAFLEAVKRDPELQAKLRQPGADPVAIATEQGFHLEIDATRMQELDFSEELDDKRLEHVKGGGGLNPVSPDSNGIKMIYKLNPENSMRNLGMHC